MNRFKFCIFDRLNTTGRYRLWDHCTLWIALNFVSLTDWIQRSVTRYRIIAVVNRFKFCIFDRLNTTSSSILYLLFLLWIALNFVSLTDWIQQELPAINTTLVVNRFKFCIFDRLNTTTVTALGNAFWLWIALNFVSLTDWIQLLTKT